MRRTLTLALAVLAITTASCIPPTVVQMTLAPADTQSAAAALGPGTATVTGSALVRQAGGGVVTCAGNDVYLIPATASGTGELVRIFGSRNGYVRRGGDTEWGGGTLVEALAPNRRGVCNAQGFFTFDQVRAGEWHIMTTITWLAGGDYQGGALLATTTVADGGRVEVVLAQ